MSRAAQNALIRIEALAWMTRTHYNPAPYLLGSAGLLCAAPAAGIARLLAALGFFVCASGAIIVVNDLMDHGDDERTAPFLPLPSGLLTRAQAWLGVAALLAAAAWCLVAASPDLRSVLSVCAALAVAVAASVAYSLVKHRGVLGSWAAGVSWAVCPVCGWLMGGGGELVAIAALALYALVAGFSTNLLAGVRDVDRDPSVGNRTVAVQLGPVETFRLAARWSALATGLVAATGLWWAGRGGDWRFILVLAPVAIGMARVYGPARRALAAPDAGRQARNDAVLPFQVWENWRTVAFACAFSFWAGLAISCANTAFFMVVHPLYRRRLVEGGLVTRLRRDRPTAVGGALDPRST